MIARDRVTIYWFVLGVEGTTGHNGSTDPLMIG